MLKTYFSTVIVLIIVLLCLISCLILDYFMLRNQFNYSITKKQIHWIRLEIETTAGYNMQYEIVSINTFAIKDGYILVQNLIPNKSCIVLESTITYFTNKSLWKSNKNGPHVFSFTLNFLIKNKLYFCKAARISKTGVHVTYVIIIIEKSINAHE